MNSLELCSLAGMGIVHKFLQLIFAWILFIYFYFVCLWCWGGGGGGDIKKSTGFTFSSVLNHSVSEYL